MRQHTIGPETAIYTMSADHAPALTIDPGDMVVVRTVDCYGGKLTEDPTTYDAISAPLRNPATGPIAVRGADPGDTVIVEIQDIQVPTQGVMVLRPGAGLYGSEGEPPVVRQVAIGADRVSLSAAIELPCRPMIGVLGVAPATGEISNRYPGDHGANLDTQDICAGSRVFLRVQAPGALLALGDVKAAMGDGESTGTGVEISATVRLCILLQKGSVLTRPYIETATHWVTVASSETYRDAMKDAFADMVKLLTTRYRFDATDAAYIVGGWADLRISQIVNPLPTVRYRQPKSILPTTINA
jgi:amidase